MTKVHIDSEGIHINGFLITRDEMRPTNKNKETIKQMKKLKVYLAAPWFNEEQSERELRIKNKLKELGFNVWSPRDESKINPTADKESRVKSFNDNVNNIKDAHVIFAITDGKDIGTIWETGVAYGLNTQRPKSLDIKIVYYCETLPPNANFNLMLAESGDVVITDFEDLDNLKEYLEKGKEYVGNIE